MLDYQQKQVKIHVEIVIFLYNVTCTYILVPVHSNLHASSVYRVLSLLPTHTRTHAHTHTTTHTRTHI